MKKSLLALLILSHFTASAQRTSPPSVGGGREGVDYAVFFVASKFDNGWTTLEHAPGEVKAISDLLREQYGFDVRIVTDATRAKIVQTLAEYKRKPYGPQDQLLLFFSMHGVHDADSDQGYLVPKDGLYDDPSYESWFSHGTLRDLAHSMKCPRVLVALDACYSGIFGKGRDKPGPPVWENTPDCQSKVRAAFTSSPTRKYLTAGGDTRVPAKSIFAAQWQVALKTGAGSDDLLSYTELMAKLDEFRDPRPTWGNFVPGTDGDFVFVRKNPCAAQAKSETSDAEEQTWKIAQKRSDGQIYLEEYPQGKYAAQAKTLGIEPKPIAFQILKGKVRDTETGEDLIGAKVDLADGKGGALTNYEGEFVLRTDRFPATIKISYTGYASQEVVVTDPTQKIDIRLSHIPFVFEEVTIHNLPDPASEKSNSPNNGALMPDGMVFVKGGTFLMGSPSTEADRNSDEHQHEVELSDFYIGKYEVTQKQWRDVMGSDPPELYFKNCDNCPVERVSWNDIQEFIKKLNQQTGKNYRLPTEAEWEYAARGGGKATLFSNGKNIADPKEINFDGSEAYKRSYSLAGEYRSKTVPVGSLNSPNTLGLHDMSGNVYEWCSDWYGSDYYKSSAVKNPTGPGSGSDRVFRGGSWVRYPQDCRAAIRGSTTPGYRSHVIGFRLARTN